MQYLKLILVFSLFSLFGLTSMQAQDAKPKNKKVVTEEFEVQGVCGMCKQRIENAAMIKGVISAEWDKDTGIMNVVYRTKKVDSDTIHKAIAEVGHQTSKMDPNMDAYEYLPACCQYQTIEKH